MEIVYMALKSIIKQKNKIVLIIIQLYIGSLSLIIGFSGISDFFQNNSHTKQLVSLDTIHLSNKNVTNQPSYEKQKEMYATIKSDIKTEEIGTFFTQDYNGELNENLKLLFVDQGFLNMSTIRLSSGFGFSKDDFSIKKDLLPVIVGSRLQDKYPINSTHKIEVTDFYTNNVIEIDFYVIGVLDSEMRFFKGGSSLITENWLHSENLLMFPIIEELDSPIRLLSNILIKKKSNYEMLDYKQHIKQVLKNKGFQVYVMDLKEQILLIFNRDKTIFYSFLFFAILILVLTTFGLVGLLLSSLYTRRREFGIRYALGSTHSKLASLIVIETLILYLFSTFLCVISLFCINLFIDNNLIELNFFTVSSTLTIVLIFSIATLSIPIWRLIKTNPIVLIRGRTGQM